MARTLKNVDAHAAAKLKEEGALMVDVRESGEYARARVPGSQNIALSRLEQTDLPLEPNQAVVFFCASGNRTNVYAAQLAEKAGAAEAYVMQGGLSAWGRAGLPVESGSSGENDEGARGSGFFSRMFSR
jgi:rhodanese-related sulfurtransferase